MLESISIKNYALIEQLDIDLSDGLNVITGETGAGKSIVINALTLLLGARASRENIRKDKKKMIVSGQFRLKDSLILEEILAKKGIELEGDTLILSREVDRNGKNVCRVNGTIVPLSFFRDIGNQLIDIYSQHEHVSLFKPDYQRSLLDLYGGENLINLKKVISEKAVSLRDLAKRIKNLQASSRELKQQQSINKHQLSEIQKAHLKSGEEESLVSREKELSEQKKLSSRVNEMRTLLFDEDETESIESQLGHLSNVLEKLVILDPDLEEYRKELESILTAFNTLSYDLTRYIDNIEYDQREHNEILQRLSTIEKLKKQFGSTIDEILDYGESLKEKIYIGDDAGQLLTESKNAYKSLRKEYNKESEELTALREKAAQNLKKDLERELSDLAMDKARVEVQIDTDKDLISMTGQDSVSFLISVNPGLEPRALRQVASGGEISRIMLSLKGLFGERDRIETLIFDEIDTGISGRTAQVVAEKMLHLAKKRQIICITHLPQIAAMADTQFVVEKTSDENSTEVTFNQLKQNERQEELARMLGGAQVTDVTRKNADELLEQASLLKK